MKPFTFILIASVMFGNLALVAHAETVAGNADLKAEFQADLPKTYGQVINQVTKNGINAATGAKAVVGADIPVLPVARISTDTELQAVVQKVQADPNFQLAESDSDHVRVVSIGHALLFAFLPVPVEVETTIDASGKSTVSLPWYRFLLRNQDEKTVEAGLDAKTQAAAQVPTPSGKLSVNDQAAILLALQSSLPTYFTEDSTVETTATAK